MSPGFLLRALTNSLQLECEISPFQAHHGLGFMKVLAVKVLTSGCSWIQFFDRLTLANGALATIKVDSLPVRYGAEVGPAEAAKECLELASVLRPMREAAPTN